MNIKNMSKSLINKFKGDNKEDIIEEQMKEIVSMMKEDAEVFEDEFLGKYAELIEEITELQGKEIEKYDKLVNLTSHDINILDENNKIIMKIKPSGNLARVKKDSEVVKNIIVNDKTIEISKNTFGEVENLPVPKEGVGYIVSRMVVNERENRNDLFYPQELVYNEEGDIIGCRKLGQ